GRAQLVALSDEGRALLDERVVRREAWFNELLSDWPEEDVQAFISYVDRFCDTVAADERHRPGQLPARVVRRGLRRADASKSPARRPRSPLGRLALCQRSHAARRAHTPPQTWRGAAIHVGLPPLAMTRHEHQAQRKAVPGSWRSV